MIPPSNPRSDYSSHSTLNLKDFKLEAFRSNYNTTGSTTSSRLVLLQSLEQAFSSFKERQERKPTEQGENVDEKRLIVSNSRKQ